jgi:thymidylate synthase
MTDEPVEIVWPAFLTNQLELGNPYANVAIVCGWTRRALVRQKLEALDPTIMDRVAAIGQMYTAERGVDMLVRNLLANPRINTLIFMGRDVSGASREAESFFIHRERYGLEKASTSSGSEYFFTRVAPKARLWANVNPHTVENLRRNLEILRPASDEPAGIIEIVNDFHGKGAPTGYPEVVPPPITETDTYPAPDSVQVLRAKTVGEGWLELLHYILSYGKRVPTHYDQDTLEIMDLVMVITEQNPTVSPSNLPEYMPFMHDHVRDYIDGLMSPEKKEDLTYTYGNLMRAHFGKDQLIATANKLWKDRGTRSAVVSLWDPANPMKGSPCLNHLWFRIIEEKLFMTATIRSNDMFQGWPENAFGLRHLQEWMRTMVLKMEGEYQDDKGLGLGDLVIVSQSAHIYEDCWQPAKEIVEKHRKRKEWWDEKGQWTIAPNENAPKDMAAWRPVIATLYSMEGERLAQIKGTPTHVRREIARRGLISDIGHALYVGQRLEEASRE